MLSTREVLGGTARQLKDIPKRNYGEANFTITPVKIFFKDSFTGQLPDIGAIFAKQNYLLDFAFQREKLKINGSPSAPER